MNTMTDHTMKAFDTDLQDLARMVAEMGGLAEKQVASWSMPWRSAIPRWRSA